MGASYYSERIKYCVIITGMSGGGKSSALNVFEDQGFYAIDNLPPTLLPQLLDVLSNNQSAVTNGVAAVVDVRSEELLNDLEMIVSNLRSKVERIDVIFMDASDDTLVRRFETTRRTHPLAAGTTILGGISRERGLLAKIKTAADIVIDTSGLKSNEFRAKLLNIMGETSKKLTVIFSSFGFKFGVPQDSDYVLDVRFLPNPNYVDELHLLSGKDAAVQKYLAGFSDFGVFLEKTLSLLEFISSVYSGTGKTQMHVAVGCTGGRHRSVAVTEALAAVFKKNGSDVVVDHRDMDKGNVW